MIYYHFNIPTVGPFRFADTHIGIYMYTSMWERIELSTFYVNCGSIARQNY